MARSKHTKGELSAAEYDGFLEKEIQSVITLQEEIGLDLLVHGEVCSILLPLSPVSP